MQAGGMAFDGCQTASHSQVCWNVTYASHSHSVPCRRRLRRNVRIGAGDIAWSCQNLVKLVTILFTLSPNRRVSSKERLTSKQRQAPAWKLFNHSSTWNCPNQEEFLTNRSSWWGSSLEFNGAHVIHTYWCWGWNLLCPIRLHEWSKVISGTLSEMTCPGLTDMALYFSIVCRWDAITGYNINLTSP